MTRKQQRIATIAFIISGVAIAVALSLYALRDNVTYFKTPTDLITMPRTANTTQFIRLGGQVEFGSIEKTGLVTRFVVTDLVNDVPVEYSGVVPDLFKEGKGVVAIGTYDGIFHASQILAKHDENYTPPDVAKVLKENAGKASMNK